MVEELCGNINKQDVLHSNCEINDLTIQQPNLQHFWLERVDAFVMAKRLQLALHLLFLSTQKDTRMNQAFQAAAAAYKFAPNLTHKQEVMRMYRRFVKKSNHLSSPLISSV